MFRPRFRIALVSALLLVGQGSAWAWGHPGHQLVGSLADELLVGSNAAKKVGALLGPGLKNLKTAAPWPDCVRDVERRASGAFVYNDHSKFHSPACVPFEGAAERARMEDYARRNWTNCPGEGNQAPKACHRQYHFTDVAIQQDHYSRDFAGTSERDIVSAIAAAIKVLQGGPPATAPFQIKDKKEALLLIAHLVGDLHQPLHVGAVYLSDAGDPVDPGASAAIVDPTTVTRGGNKLEIGDLNLHAEWDDVPSSISLGGLATGPGQKRRVVLMAAARALPATPGDVGSWPAAWASETVAVSRQAFAGLRFTRKGVLNTGDWAVQFNDREGYGHAMDALQTAQVERAAAHLAALLRAIWP